MMKMKTRFDQVYPSLGIGTECELNGVNERVLELVDGFPAVAELCIQLAPSDGFSEFGAISGRR